MSRKVRQNNNNDGTTYERERHPLKESFLWTMKITKFYKKNHISNPMLVQLKFVLKVSKLWEY